MQTIDTLKSLLTAGAAITVDAKKIGVNHLNELAVCAANHSAKLTIINADALLPETLKGLAIIGGGALSIEF